MSGRHLGKVDRLRVAMYLQPIYSHAKRVLAADKNEEKRDEIQEVITQLDNLRTEVEADLAGRGEIEIYQLLGDRLPDIRKITTEQADEAAQNVMLLAAELGDIYKVDPGTGELL